MPRVCCLSLGCMANAADEVVGEPVVHLIASTSRPDSDWVVKLIDVYPNRETRCYGHQRRLLQPDRATFDMNGYELPVAIEIFRGRYRTSFQDRGQPAAIVERMGAVQGKIQTVEDIYQLVRTAVASKRPIRATYHGHERRLCPHRVGRNHEGELRVLCYQYAGDSRSGLQATGSSANWRCLAIEKLSKVALLDEAWHTAPDHSRPQTCVAEVDVDAED